MSSNVTRRTFGGAISATVLAVPRVARALEEEGAFHPRLVDFSGSEKKDDESETLLALGRWSWELVRRTSAPAKVLVERITPARLIDEPFAVWRGGQAPSALSDSALARLRDYLSLGGLLLVDDRSSEGVFAAGAERELRRALPDGNPIEVPKTHVLFKSFYLLDGAAGRIAGPSPCRGITRGKNLQVVFVRTDLLGALTPTSDGRGFRYPVEPGGARQRELAVRFAVNLAMYALSGDYKDDQVHAATVMRRRGGAR